MHRPSVISGLAIAAALLGGVLSTSCGTNPPNTFGVNLTITTTPAVRPSVARIDLQVSGAETFMKTFSASEIKDGEVRVQYVPKVKTGTLTFAAVGLSPNGATVATGASSPVTIADGSAANTTVTLDVVVLKGLGQACAAQAECTSGLTCLDGVCCGVAVCPQCMNCGPSGACDVKVGGPMGVEDTSNNKCDGANICNNNGVCTKQLGQPCNADAECVSSACVDKVCCGFKMCPQCMNCGPSGMCDVRVTNADDNSPNLCTMDNSCDATGACKAKWTEVSILNNVTFGNWGFATGLGGSLFLASASGCSTAFVKRFDVATGAVVNEGTTVVVNGQTTAPVDACGFGGYLTPSNDRIYYIGNNASALVAGKPWASLPYPLPRGEAGYATLGAAIYQIGGRDPNNADQSGVSIYTPSTNAWTMTTAAPVAGTSWCAGTIGTKIYILGGSAANGMKMFALDTTSNSWSSLPDTPARCFRSHAPTWRGHLAVPTGQLIHVWDPMTGWSAPITLPAGGLHWEIAVANGTDLYAIGDFGANLVIYKYTFN